MPARLTSSSTKSSIRRQRAVLLALGKLKRSSLWLIHTMIKSRFSTGQYLPTWLLCSCIRMSQDSLDSLYILCCSLTAFEDAWPKMEKWFSKFGALKTVDASQDADDVFSKAEAILVETIKKVMPPLNIFTHYRKLKLVCILIIFFSIGSSQHHLRRTYSLWRSLSLRRKRNPRNQRSLQCVLSSHPPPSIGIPSELISQFIMSLTGAPCWTIWRRDRSIQAFLKEARIQRRLWQKIRI